MAQPPGFASTFADAPTTRLSLHRGASRTGKASARRPTRPAKRGTCHLRLTAAIQSPDVGGSDGSAADGAFGVPVRDAFAAQHRPGRRLPSGLIEADRSRSDL